MVIDKPTPSEEEEYLYMKLSSVEQGCGKEASYFFSLEGYAHKNLFAGLKNVWDVLPKLNSYLKSLPLGHIACNIPEGVHLVSPELITIGKGSSVEPGAYIKGPCFIGENCTIRHGAYIRGDVLVGNNCVIGHDTELKGAIFLDGAQAAHFAYVGDTILGNNVNLGAGTKCANLKLDHKEITVLIGEKKCATGLRKFGAIIGDNTQIGCNSVTNPGTLIGQSVWIYPTLNVGGFIPTNSVVKLEAKLSIKTR